MFVPGRCNALSSSTALCGCSGIQKVISPYSSDSLVRPATTLAQKSDAAADSAARARWVRKARVVADGTVEQSVKEGAISRCCSDGSGARADLGFQSQPS